VGASYHHDVIGRVSDCPAYAPSLLALALDLALLVLLQQHPCCFDVLKNALLFNHFVWVESVVASSLLLWPHAHVLLFNHLVWVEDVVAEIGLALAWLEAAKVEFGWGSEFWFDKYQCTWANAWLARGSRANIHALPDLPLSLFVLMMPWSSTTHDPSC
jgi:hypothetical protein